VGSEAADGEDENAADNHPDEFSKSLLERVATAGASHGGGLQSAAGRFAGQRDDQRRDRRFPGLHARAHVARRESAKAARWRGTQVARGWRYSFDRRLVSGQRLPRWLRRSQRKDPARLGLRGILAA